MFTKKTVFDNINIGHDFSDNIFNAFDEKHLGGNVMIRAKDGGIRKRHIDDIFSMNSFRIDVEISVLKDENRVECKMSYNKIVKILMLIFILMPAVPAVVSVFKNLPDFDWIFCLIVIFAQAVLYLIFELIFIAASKRRINLLKKCCYNSDAKF